MDYKIIEYDYVTDECLVRFPNGVEKWIDNDVIDLELQSYYEMKEQERKEEEE